MVWYMKIEVDYIPGEKVMVKPISADGRVTGMFVGPHATEYKVRYYDGMKPCDEYFTSEDLQPLTTPEKWRGR